MPFLIGNISLVSDGLAAMLFSSGWVHMATSGLVSKPPGITQTSITQPLSKRSLRFMLPPLVVLRKL